MAAGGQQNRGKFLTPAHHDSYRLQMQEMRALDVQQILEIGPGDGTVTNFMRYLGLQYFTMDITPQSNPAILGQLETLDPAPYRKRFDLVCAFQMLEHSPYENFVSNLRKMAEMSRKYVFIS